MSRVQVLGPRRLLAEVIRLLQSEGVLEIRSPSEDLAVCGSSWSVFPPVDVLPSLSRLMNLGVGEGRTREDHRALADQLYAFYARGCDVRRMAAIVGAQNLGEEERRFLDFAELFELRFVSQGAAFRSLDETLSLGWRLLSSFPREALTRVKAAFIDRFGSKGGETHGAGPDDARGAPRREGQAAGGGQGGAAPPRQA